MQSKPDTKYCVQCAHSVHRHDRKSDRCFDCSCTKFIWPPDDTEFCICGHARTYHSVGFDSQCYATNVKSFSRCECNQFRPAVKIEELCATCTHYKAVHHPKFGACSVCKCPKFITAPYTIKIGSDTDIGFFPSANRLTISNGPETLHFSANKAGLDQLDVDFLAEMAHVMDYGAKKYERDNWKKGTLWHEFYGSTLRHLFQFWRGNNEDEESGCLHLAHAAVNIMFLHYYWRHGKGTDDRP